MLIFCCLLSWAVLLRVKWQVSFRQLPQCFQASFRDVVEHWRLAKADLPYRRSSAISLLDAYNLDVGKLHCAGTSDRA